MKFIQYYDSDDCNGITACCVAAYSARKNGGLENCEYVFYHPEIIDIVDKYPFVNAIFDKCAPLPEGVNQIINNLPEHCKHIREQRRQLSCWRKFLCWLYTPGDVIFTDNDILCLGTIKEMIPPEGRIIAGRAALGRRTVKALNGGVLAKNIAFDETDAPKIMVETLLNKYAYTFTRRVWKGIDECATLRLLQKKGMRVLHWLDSRYNMNADWHIQTGKSIEYNDVHLLHFTGRWKPWNKIPAIYKFVQGRWLKMKDEMLQYAEDNKKQ